MAAWFTGSCFPDFIPVIGYTEHAIIVAVVLRSLVRKAGVDPVRRHGPGTEDGFAARCRLTDIRPTSPDGPIER